MASASKAASSRGGEGGKLLKGSDLTNKESSTTVFVIAVREAPEEWQSPLVMDIEENHGCTAIALNKTNIRKLSELIDDNYDLWPGYEITFAKVRTHNPKTGAPVNGLEVESAKKSKKKLANKDGKIPF